MSDQCSNCRYVHHFETSKGVSLQCRRRAPQLGEAITEFVSAEPITVETTTRFGAMIEVGRRGIWPTVQPENYCWEHHQLSAEVQ